METIHGKTADDAWRQASDLVLAQRSCSKRQPSRAGDTLEVLHVAIELEAPQERWVLSRHPAINPAFAIAETIWMLAGSNDAAILNYWFPALPRFSGVGTTYPGAYGHRLLHHFGIHQLKRAYGALAANPNSRQVVLQYWDATVDLPEESGEPRTADVPCNVLSLLKVREGRLEWTQLMRSTDLHRGLPYNFVQFTLLHELMAGWLGLEVGRYHQWSDSLHAYVDSTTKFSCHASAAVPPNRDTLATSIREGESILGELYRRMAALTSTDLSVAQLREVAKMECAPIGYQNLLRVMAAESARRRRLYDVSSELMSSCTNPQLLEAWRLWCLRHSR